MAAKPWPLGTFAGVDNYHDEHDAVFQGGVGQNGPISARVLEATDLDIDDAGKLFRRSSFGLLTALTDPLGTWSVGGREFVQNGSTLYELQGGVLISLVSGLQQRVVLTYHGDRIYLSDGVSHWSILGQEAARWGVPIPSLIVSATSGDLAPGRYVVQATYSDASGNEGGASALYTVDNATGVRVHAINARDPAIAGINLYISGLRQKVPTYHSTHLVSDLPVALTTVPPSRGDAAKAELIAGPISNATCMFSWRAFLLMARGAYVFRSEAHEPHLFDPACFMPFGATVRASGAVKDGMWIGTAQGLFWVTGENPEQWIPLRKFTSPVAYGTLECDGKLFPKLQTTDRVCVFITHAGVVIAMPGGNVAHATEDSYEFDPDREYRLAVATRQSIKQLLITVI
jgi:hypothetical protein